MSASQVGHQEQRARGEHGFGGREEGYLNFMFGDLSEVGGLQLFYILKFI